MYQIKTTDEEEFPLISGPLSSNQLSSLFDDGSLGVSDLKYLAPKQPQKQNAINIKRDVPEIKANILILFASCVSMFCHENGSTMNLGRVMCCITKDLNDIFVLLIYKTKQEVLSQVLIHTHFKTVIQSNSFATFLDDKNIQRTIHISNGFTDFLTQIGICRAFLAFKEDPDLPYCVQDISLGEGKYVQEGDTLKVSVCSWLIENFKKGKQVDNQHDGVQLILTESSSTWEMGLVGGQKNLRRIIFVPHLQADAHTMIAYDVLIENIYTEEVAHPTTEPDLLIRPSKECSLPPIPPSKAALINRMSKVGQALLPLVCRNSHSDLETNTERENNEVKNHQCSSLLSVSVASSIDEVNMTEPHIGSIIQRKNVSKEISESIPNYVCHSTLSEKSLQPYSDQKLQNQYVVQENIHYPLGFHRNSLPSCNSEAKMFYHSMPFPPEHQTQLPCSLGSTESVLSLLLSESRSQNTDLRISLSKLAEKVDKVHAKMETTDLPYTPSKLVPQELLKQITSLVQENEELKLEVVRSSKKNDELNSLYTEILKKNQGLLEEKAELLLSHKETNHQEKTRISLQEVLSIQEEKINVASKLKHANIMIENLEKEVKALRGTQSENSLNKECYLGKLQDQKLIIEQLEEKLKLQSEELFTHKGTVAHLQESVANLSSENSKQLICIDKLKEEILELNKNVIKSEKEILSLSQEKEELNIILEKSRETIESTINLENSSEKGHDLNEAQVVDFKTKFKVENEVAPIVKQIMNATYKKLKRLFISTEVYEGHQILENLLDVIKNTTLLYITKMEDSTNISQKVNDHEKNNEIVASERLNHSPIVNSIVATLTDCQENTSSNSINFDEESSKNINVCTKDSDSSIATKLFGQNIEQETISQGTSSSQNYGIDHTFSNVVSINSEKDLSQSFADRPILLETDDLTVGNFLPENSLKDLNSTSPREDTNSMASSDCEQVSNSAVDKDHNISIVHISKENNIPAVSSSKTQECAEQILEEEWLPVPPPVPSLSPALKRKTTAFNLSLN